MLNLDSSERELGVILDSIIHLPTLVTLLESQDPTILEAIGKHSKHMALEPGVSAWYEIQLSNAAHVADFRYPSQIVPGIGSHMVITPLRISSNQLSL